MTPTSRAPDGGERTTHHDTDGDDARHADPPQQNQWPGQNETQQDGKREGEKHFAPKIESSDDEGRDQQTL